METPSQFHDGVQLNVLPSLSSEILPANWAHKKAFVKAWSSLLNNNGNLIYNSTNFLRLTLSQYGKAFSLSTIQVGYQHLISRFSLIAIY